MTSMVTGPRRLTRTQRRVLVTLHVALSVGSLLAWSRTVTSAKMRRRGTVAAGEGAQRGGTRR